MQAIHYAALYGHVSTIVDLNERHGVDLCVKSNVCHYTKLTLNLSVCACVRVGGDRKPFDPS